MVLAFACHCSGSEGNDDADADVFVSGDIPVDEYGDESVPVVELEIEPSSKFLDRRAEYLQYCHDHNGPGEGGSHGQACRVAMGASSYNEEAINEACDKIDRRDDCADFQVASLLRMLYLDRETHALPDALKTKIETTLLNFKYWLDEPGKDLMCYWTENHQALYHSGELLVGQLFEEEAFPNSGMIGADHVDHATPRVVRWLDFRGRIGFSEWHSNVYFNEDIPALVNLADFAKDAAIRAKAIMVLDTVAFDLLNNYYKGMFATVHGRTYPNKLVGGLNDSTNEAAWLMTGLGGYSSANNFSGTCLATSPNYWPPRIIEDIAAATLDNHEHRQRDGIDVKDGPDWGIGYEGLDDIVFWAGMAAIMAPEVIDGTVEMLDEYDQWDGFLFGDLPDFIAGMLKGLAGTPELKQLAIDLEPLSRGMALESMSTYTYRTPNYQLSGAQDHKPGMWTAQTHMWQATLDRDAYVFTTYPGGFGDVVVNLDFAGMWTGGWLPRIALHENVGVILYDPGEVPMLEGLVMQEYSHAYFPRDSFDEVSEAGHWVMGRKGDAFVALYSEHETTWSDEYPYELIADSKDNVWIVELGSVDEHGSFDAFEDAITSSHVSVGKKVTYESPSIGTVEFGYTAPLIVGGEEIDLGPYPRWDNEYALQEFGADVTMIAHGDETLELDFSAGTRRLTKRWNP